MNRIDNSASVLADILEKAASILSEIGQQEEAQIRTDISIPVEYLPDGTVIRSLPGEPPRADTLQLWNSIFYAVNTDGKAATLVIGAGAPHAPDLEEHGVPGGDRPFISTSRDRFIAEHSAVFIDRMKAES